MIYYLTTGAGELHTIEASGVAAAIAAARLTPADVIYLGTEPPLVEVDAADLRALTDPGATRDAAIARMLAARGR